MSAAMKIKKGLQWKRRVNFFTLLFLSVLLLQQLTVEAPSRRSLRPVRKRPAASTRASATAATRASATAATRASVTAATSASATAATRASATAADAEADAKACLVVPKLFKDSDLYKCFDEFNVNAEISLFEKPTTQCKSFFAPRNKFIKDVDRIKGKVMPLTEFKKYSRGADKKFTFVSLFDEKKKERGTFYCAEGTECSAMMLGMPAEGSLTSCSEKWATLFISKGDGVVFFLDVQERQASTPFDPRFALRGMMLYPERANGRWAPETVKFDADNNLLIIQTPQYIQSAQGTHQFPEGNFQRRDGTFQSREEVGLEEFYFIKPTYVDKYIPPKWLEAIALTYEAMGVPKDDFLYKPGKPPQGASL